MKIIFIDRTSSLTVILSIMITFISLLGCEGGAETTKDSKDYDWILYWSYNTTHDLTGNLTFSGRANIFDRNLGIKMLIKKEPVINIPGTSSAEWLNEEGFIEEMSLFLNEWILQHNNNYPDSRIDVSLINPDKFSLLFGVDQGYNSFINSYGITIRRGIVATTWKVAVSLVFPEDIHNDFLENHKKDVVDWMIIHELSHARGLFPSPVFFNEHGNHEEPNIAKCIMNNPTTPIDVSFVYCGRHERILKTCLSNSTIMASYDSEDACATGGN